MNTNNPFEIFQKEAPEVAAGFDNLIQSLINNKGMDSKTKQLVYIALKAATKDITAIKFHVPMAKNLGATRDEIKDAILLTLTTNGLQSVLACLPSALEAYDAAE